MTRPDIIELPPTGPLVETEEDLVDERLFSILASSRVGARSKLSNQKNISVGSSWSNAYGDAFDSSVSVNSIEITGNPESPTTAGAQGDYTARVQYGRRGDGRTEPVPGGDPVYLVDGSTSDVAVDQDNLGRPITSSSLEPFDPPLKGLEVTEVLTVRWWVQTPALANLLSLIRPFTGALNTSTWQGAPPFSMLCHGIQHSERLEDDFWKLEGKFEYRPTLQISSFPYSEILERDGTDFIAVTNEIPGWRVLATDRGRRVKNGTTSGGLTKWKTLKDEEDNPLSEPVFLDGDGGELPDGDMPKVIAFRTIRKSADFNTLGI